MTGVGGFLRRIVGALDRAGIPHMVAGSFASTHHGSPRTTHDIDFVIDASASALGTFVSLLPVSSYYVDRDAAMEALRTRTMFNVVDVFVATAEDTILTKLEWSKLAGGSERQLRDVEGILRLQAGALDRPYIDRWARELGVEETWARLSAVSPP